MSAPSPRAPERTAVYGPASTESPVARPANALATEIDLSGGEGFERQSYACRSQSHRDEMAISAAQPSRG
jgi:hypothetical protein